MEWYTIRSVFTKGVSQKLPRPSAGGVSYVLQAATTASDCKAEPTRGHCRSPRLRGRQFIQTRSTNGIRTRCAGGA